ncbi:MAG: type III secretion system inner membrane ring subunit SctD [Chlamydiales bacterium]
MMSGYLIAEEGPLTGVILPFEEGEEWVIGRDPDAATLVLEDPMVSRRHVIVHATSEGYLLENLSSVNPATQNGKLVTESVLLHEGDILQIGSTFFRFTTKKPIYEEEMGGIAPSFEKGLDDAALESTETRWLLKVITGPNAGAEFAMRKGGTYIVGKDPNACDIIFHDLSVSRQHAKLNVDDEENIFIEDMGSRNGVLVNGEPITEKHQISSQDLVALGTTTFLLIDRKQIRETIVPPPQIPAGRAEEMELAQAVKEAEPLTATPLKDWKEMRISKKHLTWAGFGAFFVFLLIFGIFSLFSIKPVMVSEKHESERIREVVKPYPDLQFTYTEGSGKLFLVGHVLTGVEQQELLYSIRSLPFIEQIEDNVVVDEFVWQNMNALLLTNADWQGVSIHSPAAGKFVVRGYLQTPEQAQALSDYLNANFPYLDKLDNQVVVEGNLSVQIQSMLAQKGFGNVNFELTNGEVVLAGRIEEKHKKNYDELVSEFKALAGVRGVKNYVVISTAEASRIDITDKYAISGYSRQDEKSLFVLINGRIVGKGDILDGMTITGVEPNLILLEKDGVKFRINYNLQ